MAAFELTDIGIGLFPVKLLRLDTFRRIGKDRPVEHGWDRGRRVNHLLRGVHSSGGFWAWWGRGGGLGQNGRARNGQKPKQPPVKGVTDLHEKLSKR